MAGSRLIEITWISTSDQTSTGRSKHFAAHTILAFFKSEWHIKTEPRPMFPDFLFLLRDCRQGARSRYWQILNIS